MYTFGGATGDGARESTRGEEIIPTLRAPRHVESRCARRKFTLHAIGVAFRQRRGVVRRV